MKISANEEARVGLEAVRAANIGNWQATPETVQRVGRAALREAAKILLAPPTDPELQSIGHRTYGWRESAQEILANRLRSVTAPEVDPRIKAIMDVTLLNGWKLKECEAEEMLRAITEARGKTDGE